MKTTNLALLLTALTTLLPHATMASGKGKVEKRSYFFKEAGKEIEYRLFVPTSYDKDKKHPLVVLLHGHGSTPNQVIRYAGIRNEAERRGYVVVAPYGYNTRGWYGSWGKGKDWIADFFGAGKNDPDNLGELSEKDVINVLGIVRKEFSIDDDRIYLMGHSMGGGGTVHLGIKYNEIWAALAPLAPALQPRKWRVDKLKDIPVMVVTGEKDLLVKVTEVRRFVKLLAKNGVKHVFNEIEGGDHHLAIIWNPKMMAGVYDFFDKHRREKAR